MRRPIWNDQLEHKLDFVCTGITRQVAVLGLTCEFYFRQIVKRTQRGHLKGGGVYLLMSWLSSTSSEGLCVLRRFVCLIGTNRNLKHQAVLCRKFQVSYVRISRKENCLFGLLMESVHVWNRLVKGTKNNKKAMIVWAELCQLDRNKRAKHLFKQKNKDLREIQPMSVWVFLGNYVIASVIWSLSVYTCLNG